MKKQTLTTALTTITALALIGCGSVAHESAPVSATGIASPSSVESRANDALIQGAGDQVFTGRSLEGEDVSFMVFPSRAQNLLNRLGSVNNRQGSWGRICSSTIPVSQLNKMGASTGGTSLWLLATRSTLGGGNTLSSVSIESALSELGLGSPLDTNCIVVENDDATAFEKVETVSVGQYTDNKLEQEFELR